MQLTKYVSMRTNNLLIGLLITSCLQTVLTKAQVSISNKDTVGSSLKNNIKSIVRFEYISNDSTLNSKKLQYKSTEAYDKEGNMIQTIRENQVGKIIDNIEYKYDLKNKMIEWKTTDSLNEVREIYNYSYDELGRNKEEISVTKLSYLTQNPSDINKTVTYINRHNYYLDTQLIAEETTDSAGKIIFKMETKYDSQQRVLSSSVYNHGILDRTVNNTYNSKGGYKSIIQNYSRSGNSKCSPEKNQSVEMYDEKGMVTSSISTIENNGSVSVTKTTHKNKYLKEMLIYSETETEIKADGYTSKQKDVESNKYDANNNLIEASYIYGGTSGGKSKMLYKYNNKSLIEHTRYSGNCTDKPESTITYYYYPDGVTLKEEITLDIYNYKSIARYNQQSLITESISLNPFESYQTTYQYEYW